MKLVFARYFPPKLSIQFTLLILVYALLLSGIFHPKARAAIEPDRRNLEVIFFDVGQGDSILITTPGKFRILIDGGGEETTFKSRATSREILSYLRRAGIKRLDTVVLTHAHYDHLGGLIAVLGDKRISIGEVLDTGVPHPSEHYVAFLQAIRERKEIAYRQPKPGEYLQWGKEVTARVLGPLASYGNLNDSSLVIKLYYGKISFLFTGDAETDAEAAMSKQWGFGLRSTVLKAGHHGSATSSSEDFLRFVSPRLAVISVGGDNRFGHPANETIQRLSRTGTEIYRTDLHGTIGIATNGTELWTTTEKENK